MTSQTMQRFQQSCGLPMIGLGTFKMQNSSDNSNNISSVLDAALSTGYRLIDTAACYRNEADIGCALLDLCERHDLQRSDVFITSKVAPKDLGYDLAISSCRKSLEDLCCDYLDLLLVHWPGKAKLKPEDSAHHQFRMDTWRAFESMKDQGIVKRIGVSNYCISHLKELLGYCKYKPEVNQIEFHPHLCQRELVRFCDANDIAVQAYSSLGTGHLLRDVAVLELSKEIGRTPSQILLAWALQQGVGVLPKSLNPTHLAENFCVEEGILSKEHMVRLNAMNVDRHYCWDPTKIA